MMITLGVTIDASVLDDTASMTNVSRHEAVYIGHGRLRMRCGEMLQIHADC